MDILHRIGVAAKPEQVLAALTTSEGIGNWWVPGTHGDAAKGGTFEVQGGQMKVLEAGPSIVRWRYSGPIADWVGTDVVFRLEWRDGQTVVLFSQTGWREANEMMHHCSTKWVVYLLCLKGLLEGEKGRPVTQQTRIAADIP